MRINALEKAAVKKVKSELDTIIANARRQLQSYIEDESDVTSLEDTAKSLIQIEHTLQLIQINGAAVLAREMGDVVRGLIDNSITQKQKAQETLSQGILQMSDYLEYVQAGHKDVPIVLLPLLNDLRGVQEAPLFSEHILFFPNLDEIEVPSIGANFGMPAQEYAKKIRYGFQKGLLGVMQNQEVNVAATKICKVAIRLHQCSKELAAQRLWWVCSAVAQALAIETLPTSAGLVSLLGQVDRQIKNFIQFDEVNFVQKIPTGLIKNLLYYVGIAQDRGRIVNKVKAAYGLNDLIPNEAALGQMREGMFGPNLEVLQAASKALYEDIAMVKDTIELYVHSENRSYESVNQVAQELQKIADTLSMLGLEEPREDVVREVSVLKGLSAEEVEHADDSFVKIAETLINAENIVESFVHHRLARKPAVQLVNDQDDDVSADLQVEENQFRKIQLQTISEVLAELEEAKNAISQVLSSPEDEEKLEEVQNHLRTIIGALAILKLDDVVTILKNIQNYLMRSQAADELRNQPEKLDAFADSVTSVECYLEALIAEEENCEDILRYGMENVSKLVGAQAISLNASGKLQTIEIDELIDNKSESLDIGEDVDIKKNTGNSTQADLENLSATSIDLSYDPELFAKPLENTNYPEQEADSNSNYNAKVADDTALAVEAEPATEINTELLDIEDELSPEFAEINSSGLNEIEEELKSFIGEAKDTSLTFEINNSDESANVVEVDLEATNLFDPDEIEQQRDSNIQNYDLEGAEAETIINSSSMIDFEDHESMSMVSDEIEPLPAEVLAHENSFASELESISYQIVINENGVNRELQVIKDTADEEIIEIFIEEAEEEIEKISRNLSAWRTNPQNEEALITTRRSFHTLKGSGRLIGAEIISEFSWQFETILNKVIENTLEITTALHGILEQSIAALQQLLVQLKSGQVPSIDIQALIVHAQQFHTKRNSEDEVGDENTEAEGDISIPATQIEVNEDVQVDEGISPDVEVVEVKENADISSHITNAVKENDNSYNFDVELHEIFINEAVKHIKNLETIIEQNKAKKKLKVDDVMLHALHTLHGSARTAKVDVIAKFCGGLEKYCQECSQQNQEIQNQQFDVVVACVENFKQVLEEIRDNPTQATLNAKLLEQVNDLKCVEIPVLQDIVATAESSPQLSSQAPLSTTLLDTNIIANCVKQTVDRYTDKDQDLVGIFLEEAGDILFACNTCLDSWRANHADENSVSEFRRQLHTLKGSARMAAYTNIGDFSHAIESLVIPIAQGQIDITEDKLSLLQRCVDALHDMVDKAVSQQDVHSATDLIVELSAARGADSPVEDPDRVSDQAFAVPAVTEENEENEEIDQDADHEAEATVDIPVLRSIISQPNLHKAQSIMAPQQAIRLPADLLDNLVNNAGEVNIFQARLEQVTAKYTSNIKEFEQIVGRLREQLRNLEIETETQILSRHAHEAPNLEDFDPLELDRYSTIQQLSRSLAESVNDLLSVKNILYDQVRDSEMLLQQQHRISGDLQEGLMRTRMVQFNQLVPRMQRIVRQTARELNKDADLTVTGADTEIDSSILNRIVAPLEHLLRNAISHGIEDKAQRALADKPKSGAISINVSREGAEIVIEVADDGAGIDPQKIKQKALDLGLIDNKEIPERELLSLILTPGFSTANEVTQVSGRGVGMDVVANELKQLSGSLQIDSVPEEGTKFTIRIPFTLAITQALLVKCGEEIYATPLASVEGVVRLSAHELKQKYAKKNATYHYADKDYRLFHLGSLLGTSHPQLDGADKIFPVLLVRSGDSRMALHVEASLGNREIVVKPLASQLSRLLAISGATILGDGSAVLILDIQGLIRMDSIEEQENKNKLNEQVSGNEIPTILVVDDSITIRKVTTRFLERNNYKVITAKDGVDAVQALQDFTPSMILLDIEMPRMDGYELASHVRNTTRLKDVPIIMITSRTGEKHRRRAFDIGVQQYLGKPYNESELLGHVREVLH